MAKPLSIDLRRRIVRAVEEGGSIRVVAARFDVAPSSVSKVTARHRESGDLAPRPMGGDRRSQVIEAEGDRILGLLAARPDLTLAEIRRALAEAGVSVGYGGLWRFFERHGISVKKNAARQRAGAA